MHNKRRNRLLPQRANDLVYVYTNSRLLANGKLTDEKRWYAENLELEDYQARESENSGDSATYSTSHNANYAPQHLEEDVDSGLRIATTNLYHDLGSEYDFPDDDIAEENDTDLLPMARYLNGDGLLNSQNILQSGPSTPSEDIAGHQNNDVAELGLDNPRGSNTLKEKTSVPYEEDITLSKGNANEDAAPHGHTSPLQLVDKNTSSQKEPTPSYKGALRSLFGGSCTKETKTTLKSSHGLVSLSKETRPSLPEAQPEEASSDANELLSSIFRKHSGVPPRHVKASSNAPIVPRKNLECP